MVLSTQTHRYSGTQCLQNVIFQHFTCPLWPAGSGLRDNAFIVRGLLGSGFLGSGALGNGIMDSGLLGGGAFDNGFMSGGLMASRFLAVAYDPKSNRLRSILL